MIVLYVTVRSLFRHFASHGLCANFFSSLDFHGDFHMPSRDDAWQLLAEYTQSESLRKHALAVEACVRAYARKNGANENLWGLAGLLHDFDYERWPNADHLPTQEHPYTGSLILRERGYPEEM